MSRITNAALIAAGKKLLDYIRAGNTIPYVKAGMTLQGMDCQGMVEYLLIQAGVPTAECNLAGSNAHWRAAAWRGTPEELARILGAVPAGACPVIWMEDGEPAKYTPDGFGNADHIGLYLGGGVSIAASASRGQVVESNFKGKTVPNGGWNRVILLPWVDYGLTDAQLDALGMSGDASESAISTEQVTVAVAADIDTSTYYPVKHGCLGGAVRRLQTWLADLGYTRVRIDGQFGPITEEAVRDFQQTHGLEVDGYVGRLTWAALADARKAAMA